jgi:hypothetical protein
MRCECRCISWYTYRFQEEQEKNEEDKKKEVEEEEEVVHALHNVSKITCTGVIKINNNNKNK